MSKKSFADVLKEQESRIVLDEGEFQEIAPTVKRIVDEGWKKITLTGSKEMCKAAWFEAKMSGVEVLGYTPTIQDRKKLEDMKLDRKASASLRMTGHEIANDYSLKVIPKLHMRFDDLRRKRIQMQVNSAKLDQNNTLSTQSELAKELDEQFLAAKRVLERSMQELEFFTRVGNRSVTAEQRFEDGIARYTVSQLERDKNLGNGKNRLTANRRTY